MERLKWVTFYRLQEKWWFFLFYLHINITKWSLGWWPTCRLLWSLPCTLLLSRSMILHSTNCFSSHFSFFLFSPAIHIHIHIRVPSYFYTCEKNNFEVNSCSATLRSLKRSAHNLLQHGRSHLAFGKSGHSCICTPPRLHLGGCLFSLESVQLTPGKRTPNPTFHSNCCRLDASILDSWKDTPGVRLGKNCGVSDLPIHGTRSKSTNRSLYSYCKYA